MGAPLQRLASLLAWLACSLIVPTGLTAGESGFFAGGLGGIATLSADASTSLAGPVPAAGAYKPENGPALNVFAGWHANGYLSFQGNFIRNTNDVALTDILGTASFEQARRSSQDASATLVYQIDLGVTRLLWVGKERTIESFQGFFTTMGEEITCQNRVR